MRIGIDATALPPQPVGAGNYIIQVVRSLVSLPTDIEWVVLAHESKLSLLNVSSDRGRVEVVSIPDRSRPLRLLWEQANLPALAQRMRFDLLHSLHYTMPVLPSCPSVVTLHDMTFFLYPRLHTFSKRWLFRAFIHHSARRADALLAVSESTRRDAIRLVGVDPKKITTTELGVTAHYAPVLDPFRRQQVREKYHLPEKFILNVGLLEPRKNLPGLLRAFKSIADRFSDYTLVMVGRLGWMYEELFRLVKALELENRVCFPGYVDGGDLPTVYSLAGVFVYPTFYEGFGLPVLEAMACGVPVITSSVSSLPEITGGAALLVSPNSHEELAQALTRLLEQPDLRAQLAAAGLKRAALFTWERTARLTLDVYRKVLSS